MSKRQEHIILATLTVLALCVLLNVVLMVAYVELVSTPVVSAQSVQQATECGLQKTTYNNGYVVYSDTCGEILAYTTP